MSTLESGQRVGRYRIVRFLGAGAMGEVYLAEDPHIERRLAIKTVRLAGGRPQDIEDRTRRLLREARAAGRLLHPNVVTLFDAGEEDGLLYLAFEFVEGCDLASRLESGPPPSLREVLRIVRQAADALDYAHRQGIVHRDIKPSNILIDAAGHVKVADFGIAKVAGQNTELTVVGSVMGSPQYLSPEQIRGDDLDGRSDIFSLGVVLYELLSGRRPFDGETITTLVYQILHKDPAIGELRAVPLRLDQLLHHMLAKDRDDRLATAGLVAEELAAIERQLSEAELSAPAAPAADLLDATRVMPSRSLPPGGAGAGTGTAAGVTPVEGIAVAGGWAAGLPGGGSPASAVAASGAAGAPPPGGPPPSPVPVPFAPPPGAGGAGTAGARAPGGPTTGPAAGQVARPAPAPAQPIAGAAAARSSSGARIWLLLVALLVICLGVVGVAAFWVWQRYSRSGFSARLVPSWSSSSSVSGESPAPAARTGGSSAASPAAPALSPGPGAPPANPAAGQAGAGAAPGRSPSLQPRIFPPAPVRLTPPGSPATPAAAPRPPSRAGQSPAYSSAGAAGTSGGPASGTAVAGSSATGGAPAAPPSGAGSAATAGRAGISISRASPQHPAAAEQGAGDSSAVAAGRGARSAAVPASPDGGSSAGQPAAPADRGDATASAAGAAGAAAADRVMRSGLELVFRVNPSDAFVLLDGAVIGRADEWSGQRGGRSFTLPSAGSHLVKIKKAGMKDYRIAIEAGELRGTTPVVVNLQPLPAAQIDTPDLQTVRVREAIALHISPEVNAVVLVDGVTAGPVQRFAGRFGHSDEWLGLSPGNHRVTLIAPGYARRDLAVEVNPGADKARQKIDIQLTPAAGSQ